MELDDFEDLFEVQSDSEVEMLIDATLVEPLNAASPVANIGVEDAHSDDGMLPCKLCRSGSQSRQVLQSWCPVNLFNK